MTARRHTIAALAERLTRLSEGYRDDVAVVVEEARQAQVDPAALRRLVAWMRLDAVQRAEREALDDQYRFLAGELSQPAELPIEGELANAVRLYGMHKSVREVAAELKVSVGKAHKLRTQAAAFTVHRDVNTVNTPSAPDAVFTVHPGVNTVNTPCCQPRTRRERRGFEAGQSRRRAGGGDAGNLRIPEKAAEQ